MYVIICSGHGHSFHGKMQFLKYFGGTGGGGGEEREKGFSVHILDLKISQRPQVCKHTKLTAYSHQRLEDSEKL